MYLHTYIHTHAHTHPHTHTHTRIHTYTHTQTHTHARTHTHTHTHTHTCIHTYRDFSTNNIVSLPLGIFEGLDRIEKMWVCMCIHLQNYMNRTTTICTCFLQTICTMIWEVPTRFDLRSTDSVWFEKYRLGCACICAYACMDSTPSLLGSFVATL